MKTYGLQDAAEFLHCSEEKVSEVANNGELVGVKVSKAWVFLEDDLVAFLRALAQKQRSKTKAPRPPVHSRIEYSPELSGNRRAA